MFYVVEVIVPTCGLKRIGDPYCPVQAGSSAEWLEVHGYVGGGEAVQAATPPAAPVEEPKVDEPVVPVVAEEVKPEGRPEVTVDLEKAKELLAGGKKQVSGLASEMGVEVKDLKPLLVAANGFLLNGQWVGLKK
jgi:hypothetical protein